jgi:hypothetical protein
MPPFIKAMSVKKSESQCEAWHTFAEGFETGDSTSEILMVVDTTSEVFFAGLNTFDNSTSEYSSASLKKFESIDPTSYLQAIK